VLLVRTSSTSSTKRSDRHLQPVLRKARLLLDRHRPRLARRPPRPVLVPGFSSRPLSEPLKHSRATARCDRRPVVFIALSFVSAGSDWHTRLFCIAVFTHVLTHCPPHTHTQVHSHTPRTHPCALPRLAPPQKHPHHSASSPALPSQQQPSPASHQQPSPATLEYRTIYRTLHSYVCPMYLYAFHMYKTSSPA